MTANTLFACLIGAALMGLLASAWQLLRRAPKPSGFARQAQTVDAARYQPMLRLLSRADLEFPQRATPVAGDITARLRRHRLNLFRRYLGALQADFGLMLDSGHRLVATGQASPELAQTLFQAKLRFSRSVWAMRFRLIGFQLGWAEVDARGLLRSFEQVRTAVAVS